MEYVIEFILELVLETGMEASKNSKLPKYIRYPLIVLISLFFIFVMGIIFYAGILVLKDNAILGIIIILLGFIMLISAIVKFYNQYLKNRKN